MTALTCTPPRLSRLDRQRLRAQPAAPRFSGAAELGEQKQEMAATAHRAREILECAEGLTAEPQRLRNVFRETHQARP